MQRATNETHPVFLLPTHLCIMFRLIHCRMNGLHPAAYQASVADRVAGRRIARIRELLPGDADQLLPDTAHIKPIN